jgi:ribosomal protein S12 methylthiotransferase
MKVALVSLGCSRTLVDSEVALGGLVKAGYTVVRDVEKADVAIVNTCGFIEEAKRESIDTILELCQMKKKGRLSGVVVLGCLAQRYGKEIADEIKEADAVIGTNNYGDLAKVLEPLKKKHKVFKVEPKPYYLLDENTPRFLLTPPHTAYVKISEGCINACSYCVIPQMKGKHRSRTIQSIVAEIEKLKRERNVQEVNLIGQDTAAFGYDIDKKFRLPELLHAVAKTGVPWLRLLYAHPGHVTEEMLDALAAHDNLCKYVDFPIEHSHDAMLLRMNRQVTREKMEWGIRTMRKKMPGVAIRTTLIVGFPGETEEEFRDLMDFLKIHRFERMGAFKYSPEEGSRSVGMPDQITPELAQERYDEVMRLQREISQEINEAALGSKVKVLIEEEGEEENTFVGRSESDAPDVDGQVIVHAPEGARPAARLQIGQFVDVRITDALEYDLVAEVL